jgi:hypothetical protein
MLLISHSYCCLAGNGGTDRCTAGNTWIANGVSWFDRDININNINRNFDQAIIFLSQPRVLPSYYQYNYLDNVSRRLSGCRWLFARCGIYTVSAVMSGRLPGCTA